MYIKASQIRAARALLDWSQDDLAKRAEVDKTVISRIERGESNTSQKSYERVLSALLSEHIAFTDNGGVEFSQNTIQFLEGTDWFNDILDDIIEKHKASNISEVLFLGGDDRDTPMDAVKRFRILRDQGVSFKNLVKQDNTFLMGDVNEYKWLPSEFYIEHVIVIYGNKIVLDMGDNGLVVDNQNITSAIKNTFNLIWHLLPKLNLSSTANVRY